jgi:hypothetical protein
MKWDPIKRRYVDSNGRVLSESEVRAAVDEYVQSVQDGIDSKVAEYAAGTITVAALFAWLDEELTAMHGAAGSIAYGGLDQMGEREWRRIEDKLTEEMLYLHNFKQDVQSGAIAGEEVSPAGISARARMYADAGYSQYAGQVKAREADAGAVGVRRVCLEDEASCQECVDLASEDYVPLSEITDIGDATCLSNCRCYMEFDYQGIEPLRIDATVNQIYGSEAVQ